MKEPNFSEIVAYLLKSQTQTELSEKTGVHQGVISDLKNGAIKPNLTYKYGVALTRAYNEQLEKDKIHE